MQRYLARGSVPVPFVTPVSAAIVAIAFLLTSAANAQAPEPGTVEGRVVLEEGAGAARLDVTLVELRRRTTAAEDGSFRFTGVPPGEYLVLAESEVGGSGVAQVRVEPGATVQVEIPLELTTIRDEVVVTATASPRSQLEVAQPTNVLAGEDLVLRSDTTLGETLDEESGISSTYFGPGASRPVIRGMGGDRIRVLEGGIGGADASSSSPDHAVASDPLTAERIEVIRGPATLLYGSSAVGGVVNVLSGRIPSYLPEADVSGEAHLVAGSAADERSGAAALEGALGDRFAWNADYSVRETDDSEIPGFAEIDPEEDAERGILENSAQETESGSFGLSWVRDRGFLGVSVSGFDTLYGVPGHGHSEEEEHEGEEHGEEDHGEEAPVRIDLEQRRIDLQGELLRPSGPFQGLKVRVGMADYEHVELEGAEVGTRFESESYEGRIDLVQREIGRLSGTVGVQASTADFLAVGEEAFVPPSTTDLLAVFAYEEMDFEPFRLQFGGRWETQDIEPEGGVGAGGEPLADRSFDALSASLGGIWRLTASDGLAVTLSRSERIPTANELFANGPHAATRAFEIGDPDLDVEVANGLDLSWRRTEGPVTGTLNLFYNRFDDYVFESFTGEEEDELDVIRFRQADADFWGAEAEAAVDLYRGRESHLVLELSGDFVRAELRGPSEVDGEPLPRIPPLRLGAGLDYHRGPWRVFGEIRWADMQDRVSPNETETDGYTLVNAAVSHRFLLYGTVLDVIVRGRNLTDEEARPHTSFLKDQVPLPGRDVSLALGLHF
jgi:iron complex outermembrane recepter protein